MNLLLVNFAMDQRSPVLGWQHSVVCRLARRCRRVVVLTEWLGRCDLPGNVEVHRVPRLLTTPLRVLGAKWLMNVAVWRWCAHERFDAAFVHMNAEWVYRLAPCWRRFDIPVLLWYAHGAVTARLHRAHRHATAVVTSTPEGFRIPSAKLRVIGQGIDTGLFRPPTSSTESATIVAVGRVSRRKSLHLMVDTLAWLRANAGHHPLRLRIIGPTLTRDDVVYLRELNAAVRERRLEPWVSFEGPHPMTALPEIYGSAFLHLNLSETGSLDKAILESLACGCPTLTSNAAVFPLLGDFPQFMVGRRTPEAIGQRILDLYEQRQTWSADGLRQLVVGRHDLDSYVSRICSVLHDMTKRKAA